jgi:hypothetical protein
MFKTAINFGGPEKESERNLLNYYGPGAALGRTIESYKGKGKYSTDESAEENVTNLFEQALNSNVNPSQVALQASQLASRFPGLSSFQPGGDIWTDITREQLGLNQTPREAMQDRDYMSMQILGRSMTSGEKDWAAETNPSPDKFAGFLYSNPQATLAAFPTDYEDQVSDRYGRMVPTKEGFTGKRFSTLEPITFKGG